MCTTAGGHQTISDLYSSDPKVLVVLDLMLVRGRPLSVVKDNKRFVSFTRENKRLIGLYLWEKY